MSSIIFQNNCQLKKQAFEFVSYYNISELKRDFQTEFLYVKRLANILQSSAPESTLYARSVNGEFRFTSSGKVMYYPEKNLHIFSCLVLSYLLLSLKYNGNDEYYIRTYNAIMCLTNFMANIGFKRQQVVLNKLDYNVSVTLRHYKSNLTFTAFEGNPDYLVSFENHLSKYYFDNTIKSSTGPEPLEMQCVKSFFKPVSFKCSNFYHGCLDSTKLRLFVLSSANDLKEFLLHTGVNKAIEDYDVNSLLDSYWRAKFVMTKLRLQTMMDLILNPSLKNIGVPWCYQMNMEDFQQLIDDFESNHNSVLVITVYGFMFFCYCNFEANCSATVIQSEVLSQVQHKTNNWEFQINMIHNLTFDFDKPHSHDNEECYDCGFSIEAESRLFKFKLYINNQEVEEMLKYYLLS